MAHILVDNRLMKPTQAVGGGSSEERSKRSKNLPQESQDRRQHQSHVDLESQKDSKFVASGKRRVSLSRALSSVDLHETLNTKLDREGDLCAKLNN